jgi:hypothetical protein
MTYYEELGVTQDATPAEIRRAYRTLARLLHPDQQSGEQVRSAAEREMLRLNAMLETLLDPRKRSEYDRTVTGGQPGRGLALYYEVLQRWRDDALWRNWFWIALGVAGVGLAGWYFLTMDKPGVVPAAGPLQEMVAKERAPVGSRTVRTTKAAPATPAMRTQGVEASLTEPSVAPLQLATEESTPPPVLEAPVARNQPTAAGAVAVSATDPPEPSAAAEAPRTPAGQEGAQGTWLYAPAEKPGKEGFQYEPLYVELTIAEDGSQLKGTYRGRYRIPDKAVSSEVSFGFEGRWSDQKTARILWRARSGSEGSGELRMLSGERLQVNWWTTRFASAAELGSGSAKLIRQRTR